jgi:hypothetical protein
MYHPGVRALAAVAAAVLLPLHPAHAQTAPARAIVLDLTLECFQVCVGLTVTATGTADGRLGAGVGDLAFTRNPLDPPIHNPFVLTCVIVEPREAGGHEIHALGFNAFGPVAIHVIAPSEGLVFDVAAGIGGEVTSGAPCSADPPLSYAVAGVVLIEP